MRVVTSSEMRLAILVENDFQVFIFYHIVLNGLFASPPLEIKIFSSLYSVKSWTIFKMARNSV